MRIGIDLFLPQKYGIQATGTWIWSLGVGQNCQKTKMGIGFEHCKVGLGKKLGWKKGLVPPSGPSYYNLLTTSNRSQEAEVVRRQNYKLVCSARSVR